MVIQSADTIPWDMAALCCERSRISIVVKLNSICELGIVARNRSCSVCVNNYLFKVYVSAKCVLYLQRRKSEFFACHACDLCQLVVILVDSVVDALQDAVDQHRMVDR